MLGYTLQRLVFVVLVVWVMSVLIFGITHLLPGSVAHAILGQYATEPQIAALEQALGLKDPVPLQYWRWLSGMLGYKAGTVCAVVARRAGALREFASPDEAKAAIADAITVGLEALISIQ